MKIINEINRDKVNFILMSVMILADILYMFVYSVSYILNIVILLWVFIMTPNILVYMRGNGNWKNSKVIK
ncbi:hypothetical protein METP3_03340 [Methanosarcinales archaeon]|nr:hypothetical protein METP3_03340 [Methanosarcinales archaeon]